MSARCACGAWVRVLNHEDALRLGLTTWDLAHAWLRTEHDQHARARADLEARARRDAAFY